MKVGVRPIKEVSSRAQRRICVSGITGIESRKPQILRFAPDDNTLAEKTANFIRMGGEKVHAFAGGQFAGVE
jgi:hypothetical protein